MRTYPSAFLNRGTTWTMLSLSLFCCQSNWSISHSAYLTSRKIGQQVYALHVESSAKMTGESRLGNSSGCDNYQLSALLLCADVTFNWQKVTACLPSAAGELLWWLRRWTHGTTNWLACHETRAPWRVCGFAVLPNFTRSHLTGKLNQSILSPCLTVLPTIVGSVSVGKRVPPPKAVRRHSALCRLAHHNLSPKITLPYALLVLISNLAYKSKQAHIYTCLFFSPHSLL